MNRKTGELILCSHGLVPMHITMETIMELKNCDEVFTDVVGGNSESFLKQYCKKLNVLNTVGKEKITDEDGKYVNTVMKALARRQRVGVVTYGHSGFLNAITDRLIDRCVDNHFSYRIIDSISSIDCVLNMVGLRSLSSGLVMSSAMDWSRESVKLYPALHNLIFNLFDLLRKNRRQVLDAFAADVREKLPPGHVILLVEAPSIADPAGRMVSAAPLDVKDMILTSTNMSTLYIPKRVYHER